MNETILANNYAQLVTISGRENDASEIERYLREAGLPVRMSWLQPLENLGDQLRELKPDLVICDELVLQQKKDCLHICIRSLPYTPVLLLSDEINITSVTQALRQRARDVVSTKNLEHLHAVYLRELGVSRLLQQLNASQETVEALEQRLEAIVEASEAAVIQLQDGIIVDANPSFARLFSLHNENEAIGLPFLDFIGADDQKDAKRHISRCGKGRKATQKIGFQAQTHDGQTIQASMELKLVQFEGEPAVELHITSDSLPAAKPATPAATVEEVKPAVEEMPAKSEPVKAVTEKPEKKTEARSEEDQRIAFYKSLENPKHYPPNGSGLSLGFIMVDDGSRLKQELGLAGADHFLSQIAGFLSKQLPGTRVYRLTTDEFALIAPGKLFKHGESLARNFCKQISKEIFDYSGKSIVITISIAITLISEARESGRHFAEARDEARKLSASGGNDIVVCQSAKRAEQTSDPIEWQELQSALKNNRIRIATRPIASLEGDNRHYYEVYPRMPDAKGVLVPLENDGPQDTHPKLQIELDKKLMQLALGILKRAAAQKQESGVFVPISSCSLENAEDTIAWLRNEYQRLQLNDQEMVLSLSESVLTPHIHRLKELIQTMKGANIRFAIGDCAGDEQSLRLIQHLPAHYLRLTPKSTRQLCDSKSSKSENLHEAVSIAREQGYKILAAATGDAHSMAVLWQLGVNYVESGEIQEPAAA